MNEVKHFKIETPTLHEVFSSIHEDILIHTFPKYVQFNLLGITLMINCIRGGIFLRSKKFIKQIIFFVPS